MKRAVYALAALATAGLYSFAGCASDLSATTPGHDKCDAQGQCLSGYVCDKATNTCVTPGGHGAADGGAGGDGGGEDGAVSEGGTGGDSGSGEDGGHNDGGTLGDAGCEGGLLACGNACVDEETDPAHCGSCSPCAPPVSGSLTGKATCGSATCGISCNTTQSLDCPVTFGTACVDPKTDPQFCNDCSTHCPGGKTCQNGACTATCGPHLSPCGSACVDLQSDPNHCGTCTTVCNTVSPNCSAGACALVTSGCASGLTACSVGSLTACVDLMKDPTHCGTCGKACNADQVCSGGTCTPYIFASAGWECANQTDLTVYCQSSGICVGTGLACP
jgi:hypothetical protein